MENKNYQEKRDEKTIEQLEAEAIEILRKAQPSLMMSLVLSLGSSQPTGLFPASFHYQNYR